MYVYTCITDRYDKLSAPPAERGVRFVCFTDQKVRSSSWQLRDLGSPPRLTHGHDINRYHKTFPHLLFTDSRYSVYVDGNIRYNSSFAELAEKMTALGAAVGVFRHPDKRGIKEEAEACLRLRKFDAYDEERVDRQIEHYAKEGFDLNNAVSANYLIVRDHSHPDLPVAMSLWWSQLFEFTKRDQISLRYVLWKLNVPWLFLDDIADIQASNLVRVPHSRTFWRHLRRAISHFG